MCKSWTLNTACLVLVVEWYSMTSDVGQSFLMSRTHSLFFFHFHLYVIFQYELILRFFKKITTVRIIIYSGSH